MLLGKGDQVDVQLGHSAACQVNQIVTTRSIICHLHYN